MNQKKQLNILCLTTSFPNSPDDSAGFFVYQLVKALAEEGVQISVLTPESNQVHDKWRRLPFTVNRFSYAPRRAQVLAQLPGGIPVALKASWKNYFLLPSFIIAFTWNILKLSRKADLILANWAFCGALASFVSAFNCKSVVTILRGSDVKMSDLDSSPNSLLLKKALKESKAVVCVGEDLAHKLKKGIKYSEKICHIPNGIHEEFFLIPPPEPSPITTLLFAGAFIPRKGIDVLFKAMDRLRDLKIHLVLAGQGPLEKELTGLAKQLKIEHSLTFKGHIPPGKPMAEIMAGAHVLVLPSHHEGRPNAALEAMAAGRPVIGSDIDGIRELIQHSETGYLFADGNVEELAGVIRMLIEKPEDIPRMGLAAKNYILNRGLTWENTAQKYIGLFNKAVV